MVNFDYLNGRITYFSRAYYCACYSNEKVHIQMIVSIPSFLKVRNSAPFIDMKNVPQKRKNNLTNKQPFTAYNQYWTISTHKPCTIGLDNISSLVIFECAMCAKFHK